jgi:hypothetical protein
MKKSIKPATFAVVLCIAGFAAAAEAPQNPYAGQEARAIKSLSEEDVAGLLAGSGATLAKAAELNGYPGPAHVLELAGPLSLDAAQVQATKELLAAHKGRARQLGAELVASEQALDRLFADRLADAGAIERATLQVAALQARLRAEHLKTHLVQTALLNADQVSRYNVLRGYAGGGGAEAAERKPGAPAPQPAAGTGHAH